jgi:hypothetical protein
VLEGEGREGPGRELLAPVRERREGEAAGGEGVAGREGGYGRRGWI